MVAVHPDSGHPPAQATSAVHYRPPGQRPAGEVELAEHVPALRHRRLETELRTRNLGRCDGHGWWRRPRACGWRRPCHWSGHCWVGVVVVGVGGAMVTVVKTGLGGVATVLVVVGGAVLRSGRRRPRRRRRRWGWSWRGSRRGRSRGGELRGHRDRCDRIGEGQEVVAGGGHLALGESDAGRYRQRGGGRRCRACPRVAADGDDGADQHADGDAQGRCGQRDACSSAHLDTTLPWRLTLWHTGTVLQCHDAPDDRAGSGRNRPLTATSWCEPCQARRPRRPIGVRVASSSSRQVWLTLWSGRPGRRAPMTASSRAGTGTGAAGSAGRAGADPADSAGDRFRAQILWQGGRRERKGE